jgi:8-oxo-dGTP pyrophosphatase MutT (NUDIX family)
VNGQGKPRVTKDTVPQTFTGTTCGVIVNDGSRLLLGHATRSPRWDIPKGLAEMGEDFLHAAARELREETGIDVDDRQLRSLGVHDYLPRKRIALFQFHCDPLPNPAKLICSSIVSVAGTSFPEFDRFAVVPWDDAFERVGRNLARVLLAVQPEISSSAAR